MGTGEIGARGVGVDVRWNLKRNWALPPICKALIAIKLIANLLPAQFSR